MPGRKCFIVIVPLWLSAVFSVSVFGADWPTFQHDNRRSGITAERLEPPLVEQWTFQSRHAPAPAWSDPSPKPIERNLELPRLRFDDAFHVAGVGDSVYFGSSADNMIYALDASSGQLRWSTYTDGPVRLAPTVWRSRLYVGSDDGFVYCLDAADGRVIWTFHAAPHPDKVLGNGKLISLWPVRTSVLVDDGIAYFGAGVFPAEGLYLYAVDAEDGKLIWKNDAYGRGGRGEMSPQGYLLASAGKLFVPSGRCAPGVFNRANGMRLYQPKLVWRRDGLFGGTYAFLAGDHLYNGTERILAYTQKTGKLVRVYEGQRLIVAEDVAYLMTGEEILALDRGLYPQTHKRRVAFEKKAAGRPKLRKSLAAAKKKLGGIQTEKTRSERAALDEKLEALRQNEQTQSEEFADLTQQRDALAQQLAKETQEKEALTKKITDIQAQLDGLAEEGKTVKRLVQEMTRWRYAFGDSDALILAGGVLVAGGTDQVIAVDAATGKKLWAGTVKGKARGLAIANGRLLVSTDTGNIHCFTAGTTPSAHQAGPPPVDLTPYPDDEVTRFCERTAEVIVNDIGIKRGYGLILGGGDGRLALELAKRTELIIYVVEPDAEKVAAARKALAAAGLYGARVCVDKHPLSGLGYPPYFADLIVCEDSFLTGSTSVPPEELLSMLKPHGGEAYVGQLPWAGRLTEPAEASDLKHWLERVRDGSTGVKSTDAKWARISRGALKGAGNWTHQYADPGNTACSDDQLVKGPLGTLWFGQPGPAQVPNRHASNVAPLSVNGRLFVQGENVIMAYDAYNGLPLWERKIPGAMRFFMRGKTESGNLAASDDSLFVAVGDHCLRLDAATGETRRTYPLPIKEDAESPRWGYLAYVGDTLFGSRSAKGAVSDCIFALDIDTSRQKWVYHGKHMMHDSIAIGDGRLHLVDSVVTDAQRQQALAERPSGAVDRKGKPDVRLVVVLDTTTGETLWEKPIDVSDCVKIGRVGGDLSVMYSHNTLLLCGEPWNGHFWPELLSGQFSRRSIIALSGDSGKLLWSDHIGYRSRPIIVGDTIYAEPWAHDLRTGKPKMRTHPVTGRETKWQVARPGHHCGCIAASPHCLFFRSWSTAYYDLVADYGISHYGGQRPGCWINFIPAGGLVLIPEASSGCVCPFALHCTVVLHPRKIDRSWGMFSAAGPMTPVKHLAVNLGAPGDRRDAQGTLWLGYPRPPRRDRLVLDFDLHDEIQPGGFYYRYNAEGRGIQRTDKPWVFGSWCRGLTRCTLPLIGEGEEPAPYTVRLSFAELNDVEPGQRIFSIALQGREVLADLDVVTEAGGPDRALVKQFKGIRVEDNLKISLTPSPSAKMPIPVLCGIEVVAER